MPNAQCESTLGYSGYSSTDEISLKSKKIFVGTDVWTDGWTGVPTHRHLFPSNVIRSTQRSRT